MEDQNEGIEVDMDQTVDDVEENDDGSAVVTLDEPDQAENAEFYVNLAEEMPNVDTKTIASQLLDFIDRDKEARKLRDKQYEEGIRRTGLGDDAPGGADFQGA